MSIVTYFVPLVEVLAIYRLQSRKLDRVPKEAVEELLGITFPEETN